MANNRGKEFESVIKKAFEAVPETSVDRLHDQTNGYLGGANICDFIVYHHPYEYYIECKSIHSNTFPLKNVTDTQRLGMLKKSKIEGCFAGVIIWFCTRDKTVFVPIDVFQAFRDLGLKSIRWDDGDPNIIELDAKKKRIYFDYNMQTFFDKFPLKPCM